MGPIHFRFKTFKMKVVVTTYTEEYTFFNFFLWTFNDVLAYFYEQYFTNNLSQ